MIREQSTGLEGFPQKRRPRVFQKTSARPRPISLASLCPSTRPSAARGLLCPLHSTAAVARPAARLTLSQKNALVAAKPCSISNASREIPFFLLPAQLGLTLRFNQLAVIFT